MSNHSSDYAEIPIAEMIEAINSIDYHNWKYPENQGKALTETPNGVKEGYIAGKGIFDDGTLVEYLESFEDRGLNVKAHVFGSEELDPSIVVEIDRPVDREEYEQRVGDIDYAPGFPEITQSDTFEKIQITQIPTEIKNLAVDHL